MRLHILQPKQTEIIDQFIECRFTAFAVWVVPLNKVTFSQDIECVRQSATQW